MAILVICVIVFENFDISKKLVYICLFFKIGRMFYLKNYFFPSSSPPPPTLLELFWGKVQNFCLNYLLVILYAVSLIRLFYLSFPYGKRIWTFIVEKARKFAAILLHKEIKNPRAAVIRDEVKICINILMNGQEEVLERRVRVYRSENGIFKRLSPEEEELIQEFLQLKPKVPLLAELPQVDQLQIEEPQGVEVFDEPVGEEFVEVEQIEHVENEEDLEDVGEVEDYELDQDVEVENFVFRVNDSDDEIENLDELEFQGSEVEDYEEFVQEYEDDFAPVRGDAENEELADGYEYFEEVLPEAGFYPEGEIDMMENFEFRENDEEIENLDEMQVQGPEVEDEDDEEQILQYMQEYEDDFPPYDVVVENEIAMMEFELLNDEFNDLHNMPNGNEMEVEFDDEEFVREFDDDFVDPIPEYDSDNSEF